MSPVGDGFVDYNMGLYVLPAIYCLYSYYQRRGAEAGPITEARYLLISYLY